MSILQHTRPIDQTDTLDYAPAYVPTPEDWAEYEAWLAETEAEYDASEPTPAEVLDGQAPADPGEPRYVVRVNPPAEMPDAGYAIVDQLTGRTLGFRRWALEAQDLIDALEEADRAEAEDLATVGLPWWASMPPSPDLDGRWTLTDAEADAMAEQSEADLRVEALGYL